MLRMSTSLSQLGEETKHHLASQILFCDITRGKPNQTTCQFYHKALSGMFLIQIPYSSFIFYYVTSELDFHLLLRNLEYDCSL